MPLIDPLILKQCLGSRAGRFDVDALDQCDSTSSELLRRAERGAPAGTVVVADTQSAGRGRRGRSWLSSAGDSLTFSLLWRFDGPANRLAGLSLAVGVALARALEGLGARGVRLKWPNDVLLETAGDFGKLAGMLVELATDRRGTQAVIGIGLNLRLPPPGVAPPPAALAQAMPDLPERHVLLAAILGELLAVFEIFTVDGFFGLKNEWQRRHAWQDLRVTVSGENEMLVGRCLGVDDDGALLLETAAGVQAIWSGDVSLRRA